MRSVVQTLVDQLRVHARVIVPVGAAVTVGVVLVGLLIGLYAALLGRVAYAQMLELASSPETATAFTVALITPMALLALLACLVWAGVAVQVANAAAANRHISTGGAALVALRRAPRVVLAVLAVLLAFLAAVVAAPLIVLAGLVGLLLAPRVTRRWPRRSTLMIMAVPFAVAVAVVLRWSLAAASVWLQGSQLRAALVDSAQRTRGREPLLALVLLASAGVAFAVTEGLVAAVGMLGLGAYPEFVTRVAALVLVGPLPWVALALQYRAGGEEPPAQPAVSRRLARRARTAIAVIVSLIVPLLAWGNPAPASAVGAEAVSFLISTVEAEPLPTGAATTVTFSVTDPDTGEPPQPTGTLAISIDGTPLTGPFALAGNGNAYQLSHTFTAGSHLIEAVYSGDATYESATASLTVQAGVPGPAVGTTAAFTVSPGPLSDPGDALTAHVVVSPSSGSDTPTGTVAIYLEDQSEPPLDEQPLVAGEADLDFSLSPGTHRLLVYYTADAGFQDSHIDETQYVSRYVPAVAVSADPSSVYGESFAVSATVSARVLPTGTVGFEAVPSVGSPVDLGSALLDSSGVASVTASGLPLGAYTLVAHYLGDSSVDDADSAPVAHTVATASVDVEITSSLVAPSYGDTTLVTVTVTAAAPATGTPTGSVTVTRDDGAVFGPTALNFAGVAAFSAGVGAGGERSFTASYSGDGNFGPDSGSVDLTVAPLATTTRADGPYSRAAAYGDTQTYTGSVFTSGGAIPTGTVELRVAGEIVPGAEATLGADGRFTITTDSIPVGAFLSREVRVFYLGDGNFAQSESPVAVDEVILVQLVKAASVPVLTTDAVDAVVGDTVTLTATLDDLGAGPTGTVSFVDISTHPDTVLGESAVVGHAATLDVVVSATTMQIVATYSGDGNFEEEASSTVVLTADKVDATVSLANIGSPVEYGTIITLDATVALGDLAPALGVEFRTSSNVVLDPSVPVVAGHAKLVVCAGDDADCPDGMPYLGAGALGLIARYPESAVNYGADSASVDYEVEAAETTTTVTVNPTTVDPGAGIYLTATVEGVTSLATPSGYVSFYASMPDGLGGFANSFIANETLVGGEATVFTTAGTGLTEIRWPAAAIIAEYFPVPSTKFASSDGSTPVSVDRFDVALTGYAPSAVAPTVPAEVTIDFDHEPGTSAAYTGTLTITQDVGPGCTVTLPVSTGGIVGCSLTWNTAGGHSFTATYSGDLVYNGATTTVPVNVGVATPNFIPGAASTAVAQTDFTVSWNLFHAGATGTVTVWGDGVLWCTTPLATLSCTGQFGTASATGSAVEVIVRYSGDSNWGPAEVHKPVLVKRCVVPDVTSANPALGTVSIVTPSNCGVGGYLSGTAVTATATPIAPNVFVSWKKLGGSGLVVDTTLPTTMFTVTTDSTTWVRVAAFSPPCYPVTAAVTGHGAISVYPAPTCTTLGGDAGYSIGTAITVYPDPLYNAYYREPDAFYSFGPVAGSTVGNDSAGRPRLQATVSGTTVIPVAFGPQCRPVDVVFEPATPGDEATFQPAENCHSPRGSGFLRYTSVTVTAVSGDPALAVAGWSLDGVAQPDWGTAAEQTVEIGAAVPTLTAHLTHCYRLEVAIDGAQDARSRQVGQVNVAPAPNCPDGSDRYLQGTEVTLTPEVLADGAAFSGWDEVRIPIRPSAVGEVAAEARTVAMTADTTTTAGFYFADTCSPLRIYDNFSDNAPIVSFEDDGCGQGQYFDLQKQSAIRNGEAQSEYWETRFRTELVARANPDIPLDIYVSVRGDTRYCFDETTPPGPSTNTDEWKTYGPIDRPADSCFIGGPIELQVEACQTIQADLQLQADGDASGAVYGRSALPGTIFLPANDGTVGAFDVNEFAWIQSAPVYLSGGQLKVADLGDDPCTRSGDNTFPAGRDIGLYALGLTNGFSFAGWSEVDPDGLVAQNPVLAETTPETATQTVYPRFTVSCHTVDLGEGISVVGDAPYCPGSDPADNSFIAGTAVQVKAAAMVGNRLLHGFKSGVVASQIYEDSTTKEMTSFVVVDGPKSVRGDYPTKAEAAGRAIVQGLKFTVGILAVAAPIGLGMLFPPAGIFFGFLSAGAGIATLIKPGGAEVAAVLDLINPTKITTCAARWGFTNAGDPTGGLGIGGMLSTANTLRKLYKDVDVVFEKVGPLGIAGGLASFGYGLYDAGIGRTDLSPQTVEELRGTSTMTGCLDDQWRIAGSNISGD